MGYYEDAINDVYYIVEKEGLRVLFDKQIIKMKDQPKNKYKSVKEKYEYALYRIKGGKSKEKY